MGVIVIRGLHELFLVRSSDFDAAGLRMHNLSLRFQIPATQNPFFRIWSGGVRVEDLGS